MVNSVVSDFQSLLRLVDEDCISSGKDRLYYKIRINGRNGVNVLARSVRRKTNTSAISFLIKGIHQPGYYSIIYLSQIDIIEVLSMLDEPTHNHLWQTLSGAYLGESDMDTQSILFMREAINGERSPLMLKFDGVALIIPYPDNDYNIKTSFGFDLSYYDFCDCMSLMLSMEPAEKLRMVLSKYFVLSELIAGRELTIKQPSEFDYVRDIKELKKVYDSISTKAEERERYDFSVFGEDRYINYFQK